MTTSAAGTARPVNPGAILLIASGATFVAFLDTTVVNVGFNEIQSDFPSESIANMTWLVTAYGVFFAALLTMAGRLADVIGRRKLFLLSVGAFTLSSALAAAAPNFATLIVARAVQGTAAAGMIPAALGLILFNTPAERRAAAIGTWGAAGSLAAAVAPSLGAGLIEATGWRAIFAINIPFGILMLLGTVRSVHADEPSGRPLPDPLGTAAFTIGIASVVLGLSEGETWGWDSGRVLALLIGGGVLTVFAIASSARRGENHKRPPALELDLYRNSRYALSGLGSAFLGASLYTWLLSGPIFLAAFWHYDVLEVGLAVTPGALTSAISSIVVGRKVKPQHQGMAVLIGASIFAVVCAAMAFTLGTEPEFMKIWLWVSIFGGLGVGAALTGLTALSAAAVPPLRFSSGTALTMTARQLGGSIGVAAMAILLSIHRDDPLDPMLTVFGFCAVTAVVAALTGLAVHFAPKPAAAQGQPTQATAAAKEQ
ncbi:DHA2 family efflux MFS transporter permease subunit [Streptomyces sp. NPDC013455]|uniref:DHA2 family efflux MFS transporter permease subunit n=1 Tax=Streptomyces sp. NPDC013455 TaxID=3155605 RepID=UPI0033ED9584